MNLRFMCILAVCLGVSPPALAGEQSGLLHRVSCSVVRYYVEKYSAAAAEQWARSKGATEAEIEAARRCLTFFALEYDRHSEDMEPTKSLTRMSWLKKIRLYSAVLNGSPPRYATYMGIPNLRVLAVFQGPKRQRSFNELVKRHGRLSQFASTIAPPIDFIASPEIIPALYCEPVWMRADDSTFSLREEVG